MIFDCAIIGGGPAGLNAALVLGRSRRNVLLFDNNKPRNAVTQESHGFITRDGVKPGEFRELAHKDIRKYPSVIFWRAKVTAVHNQAKFFELQTEQGEIFQVKKLILATGLKELLPEIEGIREFYGKSLFSCPYCDGWELKDKPLLIVARSSQLYQGARTVSNWSRDLLVCMDGKKRLTEEQQVRLKRNGIRVAKKKIARFNGYNGQLTEIVFSDGTAIPRAGGFITPNWVQAAPFAEQLGCKLNERGGVKTDSYGRSSVKGVYAAGDTSVISPSQVIIAAAEGSRAAIGVNMDLIREEF